MTIEFLYFEDCARASAARALLGRCLDKLGITVPVKERLWDGPSPTIWLNGVDVAAGSPATNRACRLDVPTEEQLLDALERARSTQP